MIPIPYLGDVWQGIHGNGDFGLDIPPAKLHDAVVVAESVLNIILAETSDNLYLVVVCELDVLAQLRAQAWQVDDDMEFQASLNSHKSN